MPDGEVEKVPVPGGGTGVNQPESPYGSVVDLQRLRKQFPQSQTPGALPPPGGPPQPKPERAVPPAGNPVGSPGQSPVPGIPGPMFNPTTTPGAAVQAGTTFARGPVAQQGPSQRHLQVLDALAQSDDEEASEWARLVIEMLEAG